MSAFDVAKAASVPAVRTGRTDRSCMANAVREGVVWDKAATAFASF